MEQFLSRGSSKVPPRFVKIDTEGFDDRALEGMSFRPPRLSSEFLLDFSNAGSPSIEILGDDYVGSDIVGPERFELELPAWLFPEQMAKGLRNISRPDVFGDIFAKPLDRLPKSAAGNLRVAWRRDECFRQR